MVKAAKVAVATVVAITTVVVDTVATVTAMTETAADVVTSNASLRRIAVTSKTMATNAHTVPQAKKKNGFVNP